METYTITIKDWKKFEEIAKRRELSPDQIISEALSNYLAENYDTTWKEKHTLKKEKGTRSSGKIPETEYKPQ